LEQVETKHVETRPAKRRRWLWLAIIVGGLVLAGVLARTIAGSSAKQQRGRPPAPVAVAQARRADVPVMVTALGTVTPLVTATVRSQEAGNLVAINFREGQMVRKGQQLALIDPRPLDLAVAQAQATLAKDAAQLAGAETDLARYQQLLRQDSIARQQVDQQLATVRQLRGTVAADRAALGTAKLNRAYASVTSPVTGRIGLRQTDIGNYVTPGATNGIATVTQVDPIDVVFSLPQTQLGHVQVAGSGVPVTVTDQSATREIARGSLLTLDNVIDVATGTVKAKARFANGDGRLFPNQFVNVTMLVDTLRQAVVVPVSAVRHGQPGDFVFVLRPDRTVKLTVVKLGPAMGQDVAVLSGLTGRETVVSAGADGLEDGAQVRLPGQGGGQRGAGGAGGHRRRSQGG
jgi:multidrug efflux system membrane fusion protein